MMNKHTQEEQEYAAQKQGEHAFPNAKIIRPQMAQMPNTIYHLPTVLYSAVVTSGKQLGKVPMNSEPREDQPEEAHPNPNLAPISNLDFFSLTLKFRF